MNHSPPLWQSPPHSTHLTLPNRRRWLCYHHNVDKQWQLSQTEGHFDGSGSNESWLWKKWHISVCSEAYSQDIKRLRPWWDASAPDENSSPGLDGMKLVNWSLGPVTSLSWQKETRSNISVSEGRCSHRVLSPPPRLSPSHTRILVLFHSRCVSHGSHRRGRLSDPPLPLQHHHHHQRSLPSLLSIFGHFHKRMSKESGAHTKGKQSCVSWDYRDCVVIHKESKSGGGVSAQDLTLKARVLGELYLPQFLARHEKAWSLSLELITVAAQTKQGRAWKCYIKN